MVAPVKHRKERSLGEMISSVSFYGLGIYAILEALVLYEEDEPFLKCIACGANDIFSCPPATTILESFDLIL